jgi:hypothetical protein
VKEYIYSEMKKFMKSHLELFAAHHSLQQDLNSSNSECDALLDKTAEMLQVATNCSCMKMYKLYFILYFVFFFIELFNYLEHFA